MKKSFPNRQSIRLNEYDYSKPGAYFITMCTQGHRYMFGEITDGVMVLNEFGTIVRDEWFVLPDRFGNISMDMFVIISRFL
jgi:hypothetical protein